MINTSGFSLLAKDRAAFGGSGETAPNTRNTQSLKLRNGWYCMSGLYLRGFSTVAQKRSICDSTRVPLASTAVWDL
jgi:hypothetical protein